MIKMMIIAWLNPWRTGVMPRKYMALKWKPWDFCVNVDFLPSRIRFHFGIILFNIMCNIVLNLDNKNEKNENKCSISFVILRITNWKPPICGRNWNVPWSFLNFSLSCTFCLSLDVYAISNPFWPQYVKRPSAKEMKRRQSCVHALHQILPVVSLSPPHYP